MWLEIARQQYDDLPAHVRELVDHRIEQLLDAPTADRDAVYNQRSDQWSVPLGDEGFLSTPWSATRHGWSCSASSPAWGSEI